MLKRLILGIIVFIALIYLGMMAIGEEVPGLIDEYKPAGEYIIGEDDVLQISVWKQPDMTKTVTVQPDGKISYDLVGIIQASGLTSSQLAKNIEEKLKEYIRKPNVTVIIKEFKSRKILILGNVPSPGQYSITGKMKLLQILTLAGWTPEDKPLPIITLMRKNGDVLKVDLNRLLYEGDVSQNLVLEKGDNIFLPKDTSEGEVTILGAVTQPGIYKMQPGKTMRISDLLFLASGADEKTKKGPGGRMGLLGSAYLEKVKIVRANMEEEIINLRKLLYEADTSQDLVLQSGDVVMVPTYPDFTVYLMGKVSAPGRYHLKTRPSLLQLLSITGNPVYGGVISQTKIIRGNPENPNIISVDLTKLLYRNDSEVNIKLEQDDIVYIPPSFISNVKDFFSNVMPVIYQGVTTAADYKVIDKGNIEEFSTASD